MKRGVTETSIFRVTARYILLAVEERVIREPAAAGLEIRIDGFSRGIMAEKRDERNAAMSTAALSKVASQRDLRLDLFRGLALWLIFLDHIPSNVVSWVTIRNYGFSDATEIFIFISGYTAAFVYSRAMLERGVVVAGARIFKRVWQIYVAHVFLFTIYLAEISYVATSFENPLYAEEMGILDFLKQPDVTIVQAHRGERLPQALWDQFDALMERLGEAPPQRAKVSANIAQKVVSPA